MALKNSPKVPGLPQLWLLNAVFPFLGNLTALGTAAFTDSPLPVPLLGLISFAIWALTPSTLGKWLLIGVLSSLVGTYQVSRLYGGPRGRKSTDKGSMRAVHDNEYATEHFKKRMYAIEEMLGEKEIEKLEAQFKAASAAPVDTKANQSDSTENTGAAKQGRVMQAAEAERQGMRLPAREPFKPTEPSKETVKAEPPTTMYVELPKSTVNEPSEAAVINETQKSSVRPETTMPTAVSETTKQWTLPSTNTETAKSEETEANSASERKLGEVPMSSPLDYKFGL